MNKLRIFSFEEDASGKTQIENELTFYARIRNRAILDKAQAVEKQIQWQLRVAKVPGNLCSGRIRVRATTIQSQPIKYVQTSKISGDVGDEETSVEVTKDVFNQFVRLAENGMSKYRYTYDIVGREEKWEVDLFLIGGNETHYCNWVKIDYEFKHPTDRSVPELPPGFLDIIDMRSASVEERAFVTKLYDEAYFIKR